MEHADIVWIEVGRVSHQGAVIGDRLQIEEYGVS